MQMHEKMNLTKDEFLELQNMLVSFLVFFAEKDSIETFCSHQMASLWLKKVKKPKWLEHKIKTDTKCFAYICKIIEDNKEIVDELECKEMYRPQFI